MCHIQNKEGNGRLEASEAVFNTTAEMYAVLMFLKLFFFFLRQAVDVVSPLSVHCRKTELNLKLDETLMLLLISHFY